MHTRTHAVQLILKACRDTPLSEEGDPDSHKTVAVSAHNGVGCVGDTQPLQSTLPQQNCLLMQHHGKDPVARCHGYFWGSAASFLWQKKHLSLVPHSSQQLLGVKRVYSSHPAISQPDLRKCPFGSCHMFSDWQWIKFGENNYGSCCCPQGALNIVRRAVEYDCSLVHCSVGATSLVSAFLLPSLPWRTICFGDTLGYKNLKLIPALRSGS